MHYAHDFETCTWQGEGRAVQARFCCWTHQCKPRVTPLERKSGGLLQTDEHVESEAGTECGMGKMNQLRSGCHGEQPPTTVTAVDGLIWVWNGYGDAVGNICTMWGCFYFLEHFLCIPIVIPLDCEIRPYTVFTVSPLCFCSKHFWTLLSSLVAPNSFTLSRTVPSPAIISPPLFVNKHPQRKFRGRKVS